MERNGTKFQKIRSGTHHWAKWLGIPMTRGCLPVCNVSGVFFCWVIYKIDVKKLPRRLTLTAKWSPPFKASQANIYLELKNTSNISHHILDLIKLLRAFQILSLSKSISQHKIYYPWCKAFENDASCGYLLGLFILHSFDIISMHAQGQSRDEQKVWKSISLLHDGIAFPR